MAATVRSESELKQDVRKKLLSATDPLEKLRLSTLQRGCSGIKGLGRMFRIIDDDGSRKLDLNEFKKGLHDYGLTNLSKEEVETLFKRFDSDNSGTIDFDEFLIHLRPPMSQSRQNIILQAFRKLDKNNDGIITIDDMKGVYDVSRHPKFLSGEMSQDQLFREFLKTFEGSEHPDGLVTKDEFINYYSGVSASIDNDVYFDLMMRSAWKI